MPFQDDRKKPEQKFHKHLFFWTNNKTVLAIILLKTNRSEHGRRINKATMAKSMWLPDNEANTTANLPIQYPALTP